MNRVVHFEINAKDSAKLQKFYQDVFGWEFQSYGKDSGDYKVIVTDKGFAPDAPPIAKIGINGGLTKRMGDLPENDKPLNAFVSVIGVDDIDEILKKLTDSGGIIDVAKMDVKGVGLLAYCKDPEGNLFGVIQPDLSAMQTKE